MQKLFVILLVLTSCAQFVPPTGGKKDEEPPILQQSLPLNGTKNFNGKEILLEFNELIDATALRQELTITPQPKGTYTLKTKANSVLLKFTESFADSTTYTFNFLNGIKDLSERNPASNLKLVFSTGNTIDSLKIEGKIKDLWTGQLAEKFTVGLYNINSLDTLPLLLRKPNYFYKTDTSGTYTFENIKANDYLILAFQDINNNLLFDQEKENFGFLRDTIHLYQNVSNKDIYTYPQNRSDIRLRKTLAREQTYTLEFNKNLFSAQVQFQSDSDSLVYQTRLNELVFFKHPTYKDTLLTKIIVFDSLGKTLQLDSQKVFFQEFTQRSNKKLEPFSLKCLNVENQNILKNPISYLFQSPDPILSLDTSKFILFADSATLLPFNFMWKDSAHTTFELRSNSPETNNLTLQLPSSSITTYKSDTNRTYTLINKVYPQNKLGSISGKIEEKNSQFIVQLVRANDIKVVEYQIVTSSFNFQNIPPENYYIRVIEDINRNNFWDTSDYLNQQEAERIFIYPKLLQLKANFEISDIQIDIM